MPKFFHTDVLDSGLNAIKTNANHMHVIKAYAAGDAYATVIANSICDIAISSADFTLGNQGVNGRQLTVAAKSGNASANSGASPDLHIACVDSVNSKVLAVTDETSNQVVTSGNPIQVPTFNLKMNQPV